MTEQHATSFPRRAFLRLALAVPAPLALAAYGSGALGGVLFGEPVADAGPAAHRPEAADAAQGLRAEREVRAHERPLASVELDVKRAVIPHSGNGPQSLPRRQIADGGACVSSQQVGATTIDAERHFSSTNQQASPLAEEKTSRSHGCVERPCSRRCFC